MKKINLRGISEILSEKELKNIMGGSEAIANGCSLSCSGTCGPSGGGTCTQTTNEGCKCM